MDRPKRTLSSRPVAICGNTQMGFPCCEKGEGKYCYSLKVCSSQMQLAQPDKRTLGAEELYKVECMQATVKAHKMAKDMKELDQIDYEALAKQLREGGEGDEHNF